MTGVVLTTDELTAKRVELLHELLPASAPIAFLINPSNQNASDSTTTAQESARAVGRELIVLGANTKREIEAAFDAMSRQHVGGLVVWQEGYFIFERTLIVSSAARHAFPAIYGMRLFPEIGGLMSYGADRYEMYRLAGVYAGKILQGANPADLPVLQPSKFELVINVKTAKALGLTLPPSLIARADEVSE